MKKIFLTLFAFIFIANVHSQTTEIDSLKQLLAKEKTDTGRVELLNQLGFLFIESKPDTTMTLALQASEISTKAHFKRGEALSLNSFGNVYFEIGNYSKAMDAYIKELKISEEIADLNSQQSSLGNLGVIYFAEGNYRIALDYYYKARSIQEQLGRKDILSNTISNIADVYVKLKKYDSAILFAQQSYNMANKINYQRVMGGSLQTLGQAHFETHQYQIALAYSQQSILYLDIAKSYSNLSRSYLTTANIFDSLGTKDSTLFYGKQAFLVAKDGGFTLEIRDAARFLSHYYRKYNADSAFYYQDISKAMNDSLFSQEKQRDMQSLQFDEKMREQEAAAKKLQEETERKHNLQYAAIAVAIITFLILFFTLSRSIIVNEKFIEFFGVLGLLAVFEFINLFIHPYLAHATNDSPILMLMILIAIGALLVPLHHRLEKWITKRMVEKNKKIRLAAAKKTIQQLEG